MERRWLGSLRGCGEGLRGSDVRGVLGGWNKEGKGGGEGGGGYFLMPEERGEGWILEVGWMVMIGVLKGHGLMCRVTV